jgi:hypothetical protein
MQPVGFESIMVFLKRVISNLFGIACLFVGLLSVLVAVGLMFARDDRPQSPSNALAFTLVKFVYCEIFIAFGITVILVGLRRIFNRSDWFVSGVNKYWRKAMKYAMLAPAVVIGLGIVLKLIDLFV